MDVILNTLVEKAMENTNDIADRISKTIHGENLIACFGALAMISSDVLDHMLISDGNESISHTLCESAVCAHLRMLADVCDKHGISLEKELKLVRNTPEDVYNK